MDLNVELPSNRKFGFFFTFVFLAVGSFFYVSHAFVTAYSLLLCSGLLFAATLIKADVLLPLNKLWMRFGLLLGMIVSPIVLGVIFFGMFTPIALVMRLAGRDELRLRFSKKASHWIVREPVEGESFKHQF